MHKTSIANLLFHCLLEYLCSLSRILKTSELEICEITLHSLEPDLSLIGAFLECLSDLARQKNGEILSWNQPVP